MLMLMPDADADADADTDADLDADGDGVTLGGGDCDDSTQPCTQAPQRHAMTSMMTATMRSTRA